MKFKEYHPFTYPLASISIFSDASWVEKCQHCVIGFVMVVNFMDITNADVAASITKSSLEVKAEALLES